MLSDTLTRVSWRSRPRSFVALMGLYESNYVRLQWLIGDVRKLLTASLRSVVNGDCPLHLDVLERSPYTTTLNLTYWFDSPPVALPDMTLRIYHDARLVEALNWAPAHRHAPLQSMRIGAERELDRRWARNMMLNKWLEYCVDRGHSFESLRSTRSGSPDPGGAR